MIRPLEAVTDNQSESGPVTSKRFGFQTCFTIVIGSMIGTGVFTSLGFQLQEFHSGFVLMLLWVLAGVCSLCGAMSYCELAARFPRSGGEYNYLRECFHPAVGFVGGWISATVGFAAPTALVAMTLSAYLAAAFPAIDNQLLAIGLIVICTLGHAFTHRTSGGFQIGSTYVKIGLILLLAIVTLFSVSNPHAPSLVPQIKDFELVLSGGFAISLIYATYAYLGWNATTYVAEEIDQPNQTLTKALILGTLFVLVVYLLLNYTFLYAAPIHALEGKVEVAQVAASYAFGEIGAVLLPILLAITLISTLSAFILAGPRVLSRMGKDFAPLAWLGYVNRNQIPVIAISSQSVLAVLFIVTGTFQTVLEVTALTLGMSVFLTVLGGIVYRTRHRAPSRYRIPWYPLPPLVFLLITGWAIIYAGIERPASGLVALGFVVSGLLIYFLIHLFQRMRSPEN